MLWLYDNFFQPVVRLKEKILIPTQDGQPSRIKRIHDTARTPFSRLCSTNAISQDRKLELQTMCDRTDPINLLEETCELIDHICSLPNAVPGKTEDVFQTLYSPLTSRKERAVR
jgi:hypothetical protein